MFIPTTQAERDRLEGIDESMREAIARAKRLQRSVIAGCCQGCNAPIRYWGGVKELEGGRTCHCCRMAMLVAQWAMLALRR